MAKNKTPQEDNLQELESALTKTEQFIEDNQKLISYIVSGIIQEKIKYFGKSKVLSLQLNSWHFEKRQKKDHRFSNKRPGFRQSRSQSKYYPCKHGV